MGSCHTSPMIPANIVPEYISLIPERLMLWIYKSFLIKKYGTSLSEKPLKMRNRNGKVDILGAGIETIYLDELFDEGNCLEQAVTQTQDVQHDH